MRSMLLRVLMLVAVTGCLAFAAGCKKKDDAPAGNQPAAKKDEAKPAGGEAKKDEAKPAGEEKKDEAAAGGEEKKDEAAAGGEEKKDDEAAAGGEEKKDDEAAAGGEEKKDDEAAAGGSDLDCEKVCNKQVECAKEAAKAAGGAAAGMPMPDASACIQGCEMAKKTPAAAAALDALKPIAACMDKGCGLEFAQCVADAQAK